MSRLTALVPAQVCARALGRDWPDDLDGRVRCIDEGTRALGLAGCCAPWSPDVEDAALRAELGDGPDSGVAPLPSSAGGRGGVLAPNVYESLSHIDKTPTDFVGTASLDSAGGHFEQLDAVAAGLAQAPGAPPVLGLISGPLAWSLRIRPEVDPDILDAASDLACTRVRHLAERGVGRIVVLETCAAGSKTGAVDDLVAEAHLPIVRAAGHLRAGMLLVSTGSVSNAAARPAYERWAGPEGCSTGLAFLPSAAFASTTAVTRCVERQGITLASADTVLTALLGADADLGVVRYAAGLLAALDRENPV